MVYFRAGNSAAEMITTRADARRRDDAPVPDRRQGLLVHIPLVVVEDLTPDTKLELLVAAPSGTSGTLALDMGLVEI